MIEDKDDGRVKSDDQGPGDQTDRIEEVHHLKSHQSCCKGEDKHTIAKSSEGLVTKTLGRFPFPEKNPVEKIDGRAHRAEPSAEEIPEDENEEEHPDGRQHPQNEIFLGQDGDDGDKGIEPEVEIHRDFYFKRECGLDD